MDARFHAAQKQRDILTAYWPRQVSPYLTALLVKTPITPNQTTVLWGLLNMTTSYVVYLVLTGHFWLLPVIPVAYVLAEVFDCCDGEIARLRNMSNPIGGKLLDGICHRATEYSLLGVAACAAYQLTGSWWSLPVGLLLMAGEAMYTYAYERRLTAMRVNAGFTGLVAKGEDSMYQRGERWRDLSSPRKLITIKGLVHYKSIYPIVVLSYVSGTALLLGLAAFALYKHVLWIRLVARTVAMGRGVPEAQGAGVAPPAAAPVTGA
jgi:phosphatidylglycerophosphate synthase